jgi:hypothetical protein
METGEPRVARPWPLGSDDGGGFRQAGTEDEWGKGDVAERWWCRPI